MKRIFAFVLCLTMLLSQMAMVAEAMQTKEQSDILYLEENGIRVEGGGQVIMNNTPLGRSDTGEKYAPSTPKFIPETLKNLGIEAQENESEDMPDEIDDEEVASEEGGYGGMSDQGTGPRAPTYRAIIKGDEIMVYAYPRSDAESVYLRGYDGRNVKLIETDSVMWYYAVGLGSVCEEGYAYVYAEDISFIDKAPYRGLVSTDRHGVTAQIIGAPAITKVNLRKVDASRAPKREWRNDGAIRTLLAAYDIGITNPDGSEWQPNDAPVEVYLTLPEIPEMSRRGLIYVEYIDDEGNVQTIKPTKYFLSNVISFRTEKFREFFVYCVDFPLGEDGKTLSVGKSYFFSNL